MFFIYSLDGFLRVYSEAGSAYNTCAGDWSLKISNVMQEDEGEYQCQVITTPRKIPFSKNEYQIVRIAKESIKFFVLKEVGRSFHNYGSSDLVTFALWLERKSGIIGTIVRQKAKPVI
jgi:hypothetical protein